MLHSTLVSDAQSAGGRYVDTVMPYSGWELRAAGYAPTTDSMCQRLLTEDFYYLAFDQRDRYKDESAYLRFLSKVVERHDGDGATAENDSSKRSFPPARPVDIGQRLVVMFRNGGSRALPRAA